MSFEPRKDLAAAAGINLQGLKAVHLQPEDITDDVLELLNTSLEWSCGDMLVGDILREHCKGQVKIFAGICGCDVEMVVAVKLVQYPQKRVLLVLAMAGKVHRYSLFFDFIEHWAAMNDATEVEAYCRESMARYARRFGFREARRVVRKSIKRGDLQ